MEDNIRERNLAWNESTSNMKRNLFCAALFGYFYTFYEKYKCVGLPHFFLLLLLLLLSLSLSLSLPPFLSLSSDYVDKTSKNLVRSFSTGVDRPDNAYFRTTECHYYFNPFAFNPITFAPPSPLSVCLPACLPAFV